MVYNSICFMYVYYINEPDYYTSIYCISNYITSL